MLQVNQRGLLEGAEALAKSGGHCTESVQEIAECVTRLRALTEGEERLREQTACLAAQQKRLEELLHGQRKMLAVLRCAQEQYERTERRALLRCESGGRRGDAVPLRLIHLGQLQQGLRDVRFR